MTNCFYRQKLVASLKNGENMIQIYDCSKNGRCVISEHHQKILDVAEVQVCDKAGTGRLNPIAILMKERVGDKLAEIFIECGIAKPSCGTCQAWIMQMNIWGISGCTENKLQILSHLNQAALEIGWLSMAKVAMKGYFTTESLLAEAILRCQQFSKPT